MVDPPNQSSSSIGIEVSATGLTAAVVGSKGDLVNTRSLPVSGTDGMVTELVELVQELKRSYSFDRVGLAVPGLVDRRSRRVAYSANIPRHSETDLVAELNAATGVTTIIENDANAAAFGEFHLGAGRGCRNMFYATLGEGIGGAFIFDGEIWRGASGYAGEFGYVPINSEGMRLEEVASSSNIIRRTRSRFHQDSTSSLNKMKESAITLDAIITAAGQDDDFAQLMLERTGTYVGAAIASVINLLNMERVVVGGEIMQAKRVVIDAIVERAKELSFEPSFAATTIVEGELGINAAATGAALISAVAD